MIGFNGGLIGVNRPYARTGANSGVWNLDEAEQARNVVVASGGTESDIVVGGVDYRVHVFNSGGTFTVTKPGFVEYLIHGGGSGGTTGTPSNFGNGGAAGVARTGIIYVAAQAHTITVGAGSSGVGAATSAAGGSSSAFGITATGGNGVAHSSRTGASNADVAGLTATGFNGAPGAGAGSTALTNQGFGGSGLASVITGTLVMRGGGGGAAPTANNGGPGGGGNGSGTLNATANTGSGGGGGDPTGGNGSAGVVIIRYIWK